MNILFTTLLFIPTMAVADPNQPNNQGQQFKPNAYGLGVGITTIR